MASCGGVATRLFVAWVYASVGPVAAPERPSATRPQDAILSGWPGAGHLRAMKTWSGRPLNPRCILYGGASLLLLPSHPPTGESECVMVFDRAPQKALWHCVQVCSDAYRFALKSRWLPLSSRAPGTKAGAVTPIDNVRSFLRDPLLSVFPVLPNPSL